MGSATPSRRAGKNTIGQNGVPGSIPGIEMKDRVMNRPLPEVELIDMRREFQETGQEAAFFAEVGERDYGGAGARGTGR